MTTDILSLAEITENQDAQYLTHNEALRKLEAMLVRVLSRSNGGPPGSPSEGDVYVVDSATGDWSTASIDDIAHYYSGAWHFYSPVEDLSLFCRDEDIRIRYTGSAWVDEKFGDFGQDLSTTSGLTFGYKAGTLRNDNTIVSVSAGTVSLTDDTTNYIEVDSSGTVSANTSGFTSGQIPLYEVVTASGSISSVTDKRSWLNRTGSVATEDFATLPFGNRLGDSGRFAGAGTGFSLRLSDATYPFDSGNFFNSYNGSTFSEAGKFIHDNTDFGGDDGNMTQTTIDLLGAMGRSGEDARYGVEFRIAQVDAGTGTSAGASFPGGTRYLMTVNNSVVIFGFSRWSTFCGWIRAINGPIGLSASEYDYWEIGGVEQSLSNYDLDPASGWIFVFIRKQEIKGYYNPFPSLRGNNGNSLQIAIPSVFIGIVNPGIYSAPLINAAAII